MAIPVARVHLAMAHAALPALLPTPPKWKMLPLLPTPPLLRALVVLPMSPPKHSRADADQRWDARKNATSKSPSKPATAGRADSDERWDAHKIKPAGGSLASSSSSSSSSSGRSSPGRGASSCERWDSNKRRVSHASATQCWDAHKKPARSPEADGLDDEDGQSSTGSNDMDVHALKKLLPPPQRGIYAGPGFIASPEPSMLPMPSSLLRVA